MTETIDTAQPEALRLAAWLNEGAWHQMRLGDVEAAGRELRRLHSALAAAEARNATLTDEAARLDYLIDGEGSRCWVLPVLQGDPSKEGYCLQWMDCHDRITWQKGFFATAREAIDAAIQARAAASISTKEGDTHADQG